MVIRLLFEISSERITPARTTVSVAWRYPLSEIENEKKKDTREREQAPFPQWEKGREEGGGVNGGKRRVSRLLIFTDYNTSCSRFFPQIAPRGVGRD